MIIDPNFLPTNYPECPISLIKVEVLGEDADLFLPKVSTTGLITLNALEVGKYSFTVKASLGKDVVELDFIVNVRDPDYQIPLPSQTYLQLSHTSLIFLEDGVTGIEVAEDKLGLVKITEANDRTAIMVSSVGGEPEGLHLVLFRDRDNYHTVVGVNIGFGPEMAYTK